MIGMRIYAYAAIIIVVIAALWFGGDAIVTSIRAPLVAELALCKANTASLEAAVGGQNKAVDALQKEQAERVRAAEAALASAMRGWKESERRSVGILSMQPIDPNDLCLSAHRLSIQQLEARR